MALEHIDVDQNVFQVWCGIGKAQALTSHTQIAAFLIQSYQNREKDGSPAGDTCTRCKTPLIVLCVSCDVRQPDDEHNGKKQPYPSDATGNRSLTGLAVAEEKSVMSLEERMDESEVDDRCEKEDINKKYFFSESANHEEDHSITIEHIVEKSVKDSEVLVNGRKEYCCIDCGSKFTQRYKMKRHFQTHVNYRPYPCPSCEAKFHQYCHLLRHMRSKHISMVANTSTSEQEELIDVKVEGIPQEDLKTDVDSLVAINENNTFSCRQCNQYFSKRSSLDRHIRTHTNDRRYSCNDCGSAFFRLSHLRMHVMRKHQSLRPFICSQCSASFTDAYHLNRHEATHTTLKPYKCTDCEATFSNTRQLKSHVSIHMVGECEAVEQTADIVKQSPESVTQFSGNTSSALFINERSGSPVERSTVVPGNIPVEDAGERCISEDADIQDAEKALLLESNGKQSTDDALDCAENLFMPSGDLDSGGKDFSHSSVGERETQNGKSTTISDEQITGGSLGEESLPATTDESSSGAQKQDTSWKGYAMIKLSKRKGKKPMKRNQGGFACPQPGCGVVLRSPISLQQHTCTHTEAKTHLCRYCGQGFAKPQAMKRHELLHLDFKPFVCKECGQGFARHSHLVKHIRHHSGERPFVCSVCGASFLASSHLKRHHKTHTGEKPFMCEWCGASFIQSGELKTHIMAMHTDYRPYQCDMCDKGYTTSSLLKVHMRSHTGERPYTCDTCGASFKIVSHLKDHTLTHTGEKPKQCPLCPSAYTRTNHLKRHMLSAHPGWDPETAAQSSGS